MSYRPKRNNSLTSYTYTTTSTSNTSAASSYVYTTTSTCSSSPPTYTFSTTSTSSLDNNHDEPFRFTVTSDYYKNTSPDDDTNNFIYTTTSSQSTSKPFPETYSSCSVKRRKEKEKECIICVESRSVDQFPKITENCLHSNDICEICVSKHIETQLNTKGDTEGILCPFGENCSLMIEYNDVQRIVEPGLFEQYDGLSLKQTLRNMPDFRWCKNAGCGSGQIHSGGEREPIMTCDACGQKSCYTHDIPWHDTLTCEEYDEAKQGEDMATQDLLNRETKQCPKCGVRITKNGGCNHMTCKVQNCRYEFCWLCLADYDQIRRNGNHYHNRTCQLFA